MPIILPSQRKPVRTDPAYLQFNNNIIAHTKRRTTGILQQVGPGADADEITQAAGAVGTIVGAAQRLMAQYTNAHLGKEQLGLATRDLPPVDPGYLQRTGISLAEEYRRPFVTASIKGPDQAYYRMANMTSVDIQLAKTKQAHRILKSANVEHYMRLTSGEACELCEIASTQIYNSDDLMPIHTNCQCDVMPIPNDWAQSTIDDSNDVSDWDLGNDPDADPTQTQGATTPEELRDRTAVREHGEIGPTLTWKDQHFTGPNDLPNPPRVAA
jgi:hypothetical protein